MEKKMKIKMISSAPVILTAVIVLAGCQSNPSTTDNAPAAKETAATTEPVIKAVSDDQLTLPEKMRGSWRDAGRTGPVSARDIKQTGANTYAGQMTFNGAYTGCQRFEKFTAVLNPGGKMRITHPCIDTATLTYNPNKGWSGDVSWGEIRNLR
jgi:hypothetical protein